MRIIAIIAALYKKKIGLTGHKIRLGQSIEDNGFQNVSLQIKISPSDFSTSISQLLQQGKKTDQEEP